MPRDDLTSKVFGRLTVVGFSHKYGRFLDFLDDHELYQILSGDYPHNRVPVGRNPAIQHEIKAFAKSWLKNHLY